MRNQRVAIFGILFSILSVGAGCSSTGGGGEATGGAGATGGKGGPTCTSVTACGGDVVGTWEVKSSCLTLSGDMDISLAGAGCPKVPVSGSMTTTGTFTANPNGTYVDGTTTTANISFPLATNCLSISSVPRPCEKFGNLFEALGWKSGTCAANNGTCSCNLMATGQMGGLGLISGSPSTDGSYLVKNKALVLDAMDDVPYPYCVQPSDTLTVTPPMSGVTGSIVFQKMGGGATGGQGGTGGSGGTGGKAAGGSTGGGTPSGGSSTGGAPTTGGRGGAPATGGSAGGAGMTGGSAGGSSGTGNLPCDIYAAANTPCVAAHSTVRALLSSFSGALYQVKRADGMTKDIPVLAPGGYADSSVQDTFCAGSSCTIWRVYDQSGHGNFLEAETPDSTVMGHSGMTAASATKEALMVSGHKVYALWTNTSQAYWRDGSKSGMPLEAAPQGIYIVTSGKHFNTGCCYDYGNGETSRKYVAGPSMDALYFGSSTQWAHGNGTGPWVMADMEDGMITQGDNGNNDKLLSQTSAYVTAMEKNNGTSTFALKAADATKPTLNTYYSGSLPPGKRGMKKQGSIVLGSGGDCCYSNNNASQGTFYEGAIVSGYPSDATDDAIHANIVSASYGK